MPVICLVQNPPQEAVTVFGYIGGQFLVSRTGCAREHHAPCIEGSFLVNRTGHSRERHAHLCNQPCYYQVVVEPGAQVCTLLEVWVLGVGMSTLGAQTVCSQLVIKTHSVQGHTTDSHWQPSRDLNLMFTDSRRAEQLILISQQRIVDTVEDSVLRTEMVDLESQEEDVLKCFLFFKPMS